MRFNADGPNGLIDRKALALIVEDGLIRKFGAICPEHGVGAGLVLPCGNTLAMQFFLNVIRPDRLQIPNLSAEQLKRYLSCSDFLFVSAYLGLTLHLLVDNMKMSA